MKAEYLEISGRTYYAFEEPESDAALEETKSIEDTRTFSFIDDAPAPKVGFWKRQFQAEETGRQKVFDWIFGVVTPVICFFFDPIVFVAKGDRPLMGGYKTFAYMLSFSAIMATLAWLLWGKDLKWINAVLAGLLTAGGVAGLLVALVITPFSLIGIMFYLIGLLGLSAWFTSFVFLRNAVRSYRAAKPFFDPSVLRHSWMLSSVFSFVIPYLFNIWSR